MYPKVSIIIPSYNRAHLVIRAVTSVCEQTYSNLEIIVVDDGSVDNTEKIISRCNDARLIYLRHDSNQGVSSARNTGIKVATGDFFAFQDTDDCWMKNKIEEHINVFRSAGKDVGAVYSGSFRYKYGKKTSIPPKYIYPKEGDIFQNLLRGNFIPSISVCVRRECFEQVGLFDPSLPSLEDWDMWLRIAKQYKFAYINKPLTEIYFTEDSLTANLKNFLQAEELLLKKHYDDFSIYPDILAKRYAQIGIYHALEKNKNECLTYLHNAVDTYPSSLVYTMLNYAVHFFGYGVIKPIFHSYLILKRIRENF